MTFAAGVVHKWVSTMGEEVFVLPVGEPYEYNFGREETTLVACLVLCSARRVGFEDETGQVIKFAVVNLKPLL